MGLCQYVTFAFMHSPYLVRILFGMPSLHLFTFLMFFISCIYRSVPQIRPPFCNLSLSTKRRGGLCAGCDDFSRDYAPLPVPVKHDLIVGSGGGGGGGGVVRAKREASPSARRRDAPDATGRLTSFNVEGRGSRTPPRSSWRVHR